MKNIANTTDLIVGGGLVVAALAYLIQQGLASLGIWLVVMTGIASYGLKLPITVGAVIGITTVFIVSLMSRRWILERFDNPSKKDKEDEEEKPEPHLDAGTTLLHAYRKLDPNQVMQMRKDTQDLMDTQKNLIETLAGLGPQIQQGAELIDTFKTTFGGDILKKAMGTTE